MTSINHPAEKFIENFICKTRRTERTLEVDEFYDFSLLDGHHLRGTKQ